MKRRILRAILCIALTPVILTSCAQKETNVPAKTSVAFAPSDVPAPANGASDDKAAVSSDIDHAGTLYTADERGKMTIVGAPDHYDVIVEWFFNPSEMTVWTFSGTFDASGTMYFEDCGRVTTSYFENGEVNEFTTDYLYATGSLSEDGNGGLVLNITQDSDISGNVFQ